MSDEQQELAALRAMREEIAALFPCQTSISVALAYIREWKRVYDEQKVSSQLSEDAP